MKKKNASAEIYRIETDINQIITDNNWFLGVLHFFLFASIQNVWMYLAKERKKKNNEINTNQMRLGYLLHRFDWIHAVRWVTTLATKDIPIYSNNFRFSFYSSFNCRKFISCYILCWTTIIITSVIQQCMDKIFCCTYMWFWSSFFFSFLKYEWILCECVCVHVNEHNQSKAKPHTHTHTHLSKQY